MGKKSTKESKNIYFRSREEAGLTRAQASEKMEYVSESRIEKIESGATLPQPDDVTAMAKAYKKPELCNYYCANECSIGQEMVPEIQVSSLSEIVLGLLSSLNTLDTQKNRLIDITADGRIDDNELEDFARIKNRLDQLSITIEGLKLWCSKTIADGNINSEKFEELCRKLK